MRNLLSLLILFLALPASCQSSACPTFTELGNATSNAATAASGGGRGSFRQYLGMGATVTSFSQDWDLTLTTELMFQIYEGPTSTGPWMLVDSATVPAQGPGRAEYDSGPMNAPLVTGMWYAIICYYQTGSHNYFFESPGTLVYPDWDHLDRAHEFTYPPSGVGPLHFAGILYDCHQWLCLGGGGPTCAITAPAPATMVSGEVAVDFDGDDSGGGPLDSLVEFSTDAGLTWSAATPAASSALANPDLGRPVSFSVTFTWDSASDSVGVTGPQVADLRITVSTAGGTSGICTVAAVLVDNMPTCAITAPAPMSRVTADQDIVFDANHPTGAALASTFEYSTDAGVTWALATPTMSSALANPDLARPTPISGATFTWDTAVDVPTSPTAQSVTLRVTVDDGAGGASTCAVDLTADCLSCGDCNLDGIGPAIIDALTAAQFAAGISPPAPPSPVQLLCCDVDTSATITVIDALIIAQVSAGLTPTLACL